MPPLMDVFDAWKAGNLKALNIGNMRARNSTAHKWKTPFLCWLLRTLVSWRLEDILRQSLILHTMGHLLGARILLRSGIETLAILINLNQRIDRLLSSGSNFKDFDKDIRKLVSGSKDKSTEYESINILTILEKCEYKYPNLKALYHRLSETAHPNFDGMELGYCDYDDKEKTVKFSNRMSELWSGTHEDQLSSCFSIYVHEFNDVWPEKFAALENWLEEHDAELCVDEQEQGA
jgi:hypothetical protein